MVGAGSVRNLVGRFARSASDILAVISVDKEARRLGEHGGLGTLTPVDKRQKQKPHRLRESHAAMFIGQHLLVAGKAPQGRACEKPIVLEMRGKAGTLWHARFECPATAAFRHAHLGSRHLRYAERAKEAGETVAECFAKGLFPNPLGFLKPKKVGRCWRCPMDKSACLWFFNRSQGCGRSSLNSAWRVGLASKSTRRAP